MLKECVGFVSLHCPPVYSPLGMKVLTEVAFKDGLRLGFEDGLKLGIETTLQNFQEMSDAGTSLDQIFSEQESSQEEPPLYQSLDGSVIITNPIELLRSLGNTPELARSRVIRILNNAKKRPLDENELETLRRARTAINTLEVIDSRMLCKKGQDTIVQMNDIVDQFERDFLDKQSSPGEYSSEM